MSTPQPGVFAAAGPLHLALEYDAPALDAHQDQVPSAPGPFQHFVRHAVHDPPDGVRVHEHRGRRRGRAGREIFWVHGRQDNCHGNAGPT